MGRTCTCEALVLKTYDIGDADRLCILLTDARGRIAVVAKGVRKLSSKWGSAMQSFQHLKVELAEHSSGMYLRSAQCLSSFSQIRGDLEKFVLASRGSELLLHFLHDTEPSEKIFALAREYFVLCDEKVRSLLFPVFQLSLLSHLGLLSSLDDEKAFPSSLKLSGTFRECVQQQLSKHDQEKLKVVCEALLRDYLSYPLKSAKSFLIPSSSGARGSSGATPVSS